MKHAINMGTKMHSLPSNYLGCVFCRLRLILSISTIITHAHRYARMFTWSKLVQFASLIPQQNQPEILVPSE